MGLFDFVGDIVHTIESPIEHLIGKTATNVLFPVFPITNVALKAVTPLANKLLSGGATPPHVSPVPVMQRGPAQPQAVPQPPYITAPGYQPSSFVGGYGPSPFSYAPTPDTFSPFGGPSWGFSTPSTAYSPPQWATYSAPAQAPSQGDRTWEDIAGLLPLVTAFL